jgi:hypothetical protein
MFDSYILFILMKGEEGTSRITNDTKTSMGRKIFLKIYSQLQSVRVNGRHIILEYTYVVYRMIADSQICDFQCTIIYIIQGHALALSVNAESKLLGEIGEVRYCRLLQHEFHLPLL